MQRSTLSILVLVCVVAAAGFGLWLSWSGGALPAPPGGVPAPDAAPTPPQGTGERPAPPAPGDGPHVVLTVTALERFVAPPELPVLAVRPDGEALPVRVLAGVGSGFDEPSPRRGAALVAVGLGDHEFVRQVAIDPVATKPLLLGARVVLTGQVLDTAQKPVRGAVVWLGERFPDGAPRDVAVDEEGRFELDAPVGDGVPFVVRAEGFASQWRAIAVTGQAAPLAAVLQPAARLDVQLAARAVEIDRARVFVLPGGDVSTELSQWPFFLQVLDGGLVPDERGRVVLLDLPQRGEVALVVRHPFAPLKAPVSVRLEPSGARAMVPLAFASGRRQGRVVDDAGEPCSGVWIWARPASSGLGGAASLRFVPPHLDARGTCFAESAAEGDFELGLPDAPDCVVSLRAPDRAGRDVPLASLPDESIVLPTWRGGDASLVVAPPSSGTAWTVAADLAGGVGASLAADASWRIALPHAGRFDVDVTVSVAGQERARERFAGLVVTGPVEITPPEPR